MIGEFAVALIGRGVVGFVVGEVVVAVVVAVEVVEVAFEAVEMVVVVELVVEQSSWTGVEAEIEKMIAVVAAVRWERPSGQIRQFDDCRHCN